MKYMVHLFLFFLFFNFPFGVSSAQQTDWDRLIEEWRKAYNVPGLAVGIISNGNVIHSDGYGVLEFNKQEEVNEHTLFSIASNTKAFIAAALAQLAEDGKIGWNDKVRTYLPYFELYDPCVSEMMTISDLLCHRSGLGTFSGDVIWYRSNYSAEEVVKRAAEVPPAFEFRNGYGYSNLMFITAGEVIRTVTGKSWDQYLREHYFLPLGMTRTITSTNDIPQTSNVATPHATVGPVNHPIEWVNWDNMGAAGGIISSVHDMLKWMNMQLNNGIAASDTFFQRSSQLKMWTPHNNHTVSSTVHDLFGRNFNGYGLGWGLNEYQGHFVVSHTGGYDGMYSSVYLLPYEKTGIVVLTNSMHSIGPMLTYEIIDKLFNLPQRNWKERGVEQDKAHYEDRSARINERKDARQLNTSPSLSAEEISGLYRSDMYGDIRIHQENGQLFIDFIPAPELKAKLSHWHYDVYQLDWMEDQAWFSFGTVQILKDNNGKASGLQFDVPNDDIFFEEIKSVRVNE